MAVTTVTDSFIALGSHKIMETFSIPTCIIQCGTVKDR